MVLTLGTKPSAAFAAGHHVGSDPTSGDPTSRQRLLDHPFAVVERNVVRTAADQAAINGDIVRS